MLTVQSVYLSQEYRWDDLTLFDWEAQKPLETEAPFTFTGYEYLDQITPQ